MAHHLLGPVVVHRLLSPWDASLETAYWVTLVGEHMIGLLLVAYVLNRLPILRRWKIVFFLVCALNTIPFTYGLNYTFFRALGAVALLVAASRMRAPGWAFGWLFAGQVISLGISPEMGFRFAAAGIASAVYMVFIAGRAWLACVVSPLVAAVVFFMMAGPGYLRMLKMFAHGIYNFVVEPLPHVLLFLLAFVWLVPLALARSMLDADTNTPLLMALYVFPLRSYPSPSGGRMLDTFFSMGS